MKASVGSPANQLRFEFNSVGIITYSIFIIMLHAVYKRRERDASSNNHESLHNDSFLGNSNFFKGQNEHTSKHNKPVVAIFTLKVCRFWS